MADVEKSMEFFALAEPIVINRDDIVGHRGRVQALTRFKDKTALGRS